MQKKISVDEAIEKGKIKLVYLPTFIIIFFIGLGLFLEKNHFCGEWIILLSLFLGILFGWLVWSYFVVKWKIWAFGNVQDVNELKRKAIEQNLIWKEGSWFEKTEFKNQDQKVKLKSLEKNFLKKNNS